MFPEIYKEELGRVSMLRRILVGLNGSTYSQTAAELAMRWAKHYQASVTAVGIVAIPQLTAAEPVPLGATAYKMERDQALINTADQRISHCLANFAASCTAADVDCRTVKLEGDMELLLREAERADLLVVGKKSISDEPTSASPILTQIVRHSPRPVLCVPRFSAPTAPILVAYDGSMQSAKALQIFQAIGLADHSTVHILTVSDDPPDRTPAVAAADFLQGHGLQVEMHVRPSQESIAREIVAEAKRLDVGLIVLGAYGKSRVTELFFGSVTSSVLRDTSVPLFLYH
jgi:nucleotide-binding universal stress UspA family protein